MLCASLGRSEKQRRARACKVLVLLRLQEVQATTASGAAVTIVVHPSLILKPPQLLLQQLLPHLHTSHAGFVALDLSLQDDAVAVHHQGAPAMFFGSGT